MMILNLHLFDQYTQTTLLNSVGNDLSPEMKTYYERRLIESIEPNLVHDQFGDPYPIPQGSGKTIEFRKYSALPKAMNPLTEGVTPAGNKLNVIAMTATIRQFGDYIQLSDLLQLTAIDKNVEQSTILLGSQGGRTMDSVTRDIITAGTNVNFAPSAAALGTEILAREDLASDSYLTVDEILKAVAELKAANAQPMENNAYVAIVHPYVSADIQRSDGWKYIHQYAQPEEIYRGEIGMIGGVRFVESTEAKISAPSEISDGYNRLTVKTAISSSTTSVVINEVLTAATPAEAIPVYINGTANTITAIATSGTTTTLTVGTAITSLAVGAVITYKDTAGTGGTKDGHSVFSTMILGAHAYATTELQGGSMQHIIKQLGYGEDPLNQRSSVGWKATKTAKRLSEEYMIRIEHTSKTAPYAKAN